jgi:Tol biopolymer transport system component
MNSKIWFAPIVLLVASLACALPSATSTPEAQSHALATGVAATLTALAPAQPTPTQPPSEPTQAAATATEPAPQPPLGPSPVLRIVYTDAGNVWLVDGDAAPVQLTSSGNSYKVLISSDGERIVYLRRPANQNVPSEVRVINRDGTGDRALMTPQQWDGLYPLQNFDHNDVSQIAFIPGTHRLMMNTRAFGNFPGNFKYNDGLQLDVDTGQLDTIFAPDAGGDFTISPDGTHVVIVQPKSISLAKVDGTDLHSNVIAYDPVTTYSEYQYYAQPIWRTNSTGFGVAIPSADPLGSNPSGTIWSVSASDGSATQLGQIPGDFFFIQAGSAPSLSPTQDWVAFLRPGASSSAPPNLMLAHPDGSGIETYDQGNIKWEGWSVNALRFAYSSGGPSELHLGTPSAPKLDFGQGTKLRWQDDARFIYLKGSVGNWSLARFEGGVVPAILATPSGDNVSYDFTGPANAGP